MMENSENKIQTEVEQDENKLIHERKEKLKVLRAAGKAYQNHFRRKDLAKELHDVHDKKTKEELEGETMNVVVAGRMMLHRIMGKTSFMTIQDMSGRIQLYVRKNDLPQDVFEESKHWDMGDIIWASGKLFKTNTGELSVWVNELELVTKALRPLPDKFHGLSDQEIRYRQRYLDLIVNEEARKTFIIRTQVIEFIRQFLKTRNFMEVETPMMQVLPGGAAAKPFVTFHHALDMQLYLRIAPELYLKRLVVGGFERVFEINRNFRNEGVSTRHNPEFTMLEFYQAYADYLDLMRTGEELISGVAEAVLGRGELVYQDK